MFTATKPTRQWSDIGLRVLIGSIIAAVTLAVLDGIVRGPVAAAELVSNRYTTTANGNMNMILAWITDFRILTEQAVYAATIFFVGAKFFETRTVLSVAFDKMDAANTKLNGPDEDNTVWIGHRYGSRIEAESVAAAFAERLKESAAA
jgi:hypothetical protein